jgi:hypothetical protein
MISCRTRWFGRATLAVLLLCAHIAVAEPPPMSVGLTPITQMSGEQHHHGRAGGLYGDGQNVPPPQHQQNILDAAARIQPLNAAGHPDSDGRIAFVSIGMSNTSQKFSAFVPIANNDPLKAPAVTVVNGAQGGQDAASWANSDHPWQQLEQRITNAGLTAPQVQAVWLLQARIDPASLGGFPTHADILQANLRSIVTEAKQRYPNLQIIYLSSRSFGGYSTINLNPEPYAYESAFSVQGLIRSQIDGEPQLNFDPASGLVRAPVLAWGPYLWADGTTPRDDGVVWLREDFAADAVHLSAAGAGKVANMLLDFVHSDESAVMWYVVPEPAVLSLLAPLIPLLMRRRS